MSKMKLILFDVDGTLTEPRKCITQNMLNTLHKLKTVQNIHLGFVGGSDLSKQQEQLHEENFDLFEWRFSENGLVSYYQNNLIHKQSLSKIMGEHHLQVFINICLKVLANIDNIPVKRGNFIEFRNGMLNISPIGRSCSQLEREKFYEFDKINKIREQMINSIKKLWDIYTYENGIVLPELKFSIGGMISVDVFPVGFDKTYCLKFVETVYDEIHFFGDKTDLGGNDYEIYNDPRVISHHVDCYEDTIEFLDKLFLIN